MIPFVDIMSNFKIKILPNANCFIFKFIRAGSGFADSFPSI